MRSFDNAYEGTPTWDVGHPQPAVLRLAAAGRLEGTIVDVGCGSGEDAIRLAALGHRVLGVDLARAAIERARAKAAERGSAAEFLVHDALGLASLGRTFDTALDVGCFHTLQPVDRIRYAASLAAAVRPGGRAFLLCWSDRNPFGFGPERITRSAIRRSFRDGWTIEGIEPERLESRLPVGSVHAWLVCLHRTPSEIGHSDGAVGALRPSRTPRLGLTSRPGGERRSDPRAAPSRGPSGRIGLPIGPNGRCRVPPRANTRPTLRECCARLCPARFDRAEPSARPSPMFPCA